MNDQTAKLLEQLAQKLGTTASYLWSVLLKQAFINAITDLLYLVLTIIGGFLLCKLHKHFSLENDNCDNIYYDNDYLGIVMAIAAIIWGAIAIVCFFSIGNIINGFFNPEYWALDRILSSIK